MSKIKWNFVWLEFLILFSTTEMDVLSLLHEEGVGGGISVNRFDDDDDDDNKHQGSDSDEKSESDKMQQKNQVLDLRKKITFFLNHTI